MNVGTADEIRRLLGIILERPVGPSENPSSSSDPKWDSLRHVELVFLLEDHFRIRFTPEDLTQLGDLRQVIQTVEARCAA